MKSTAFVNPYEIADKKWVKAALHVHTKEHSGCAKLPMDDVLHRYLEMEFPIVAITDHDFVRSDLDTHPFCDEMLVLHGFEHGGKRRNTIMLGSGTINLPGTSLEEAMTTKGDDVVTFCAHPQANVNYWKPEKVFSLPVLPDGIEIYNAHYDTPRKLRKGGYKTAEKDLDTFLAAGWRPWVFASDDCHNKGQGKAWCVVQTDTLEEEPVLSALKTGAFYATDGLGIEEVRGDGLFMYAQADECCEWTVKGFDGHTIYCCRSFCLSTQQCSHLLCPTLPEGNIFEPWRGYYRVVATGLESGKTAWFQPIYEIT